MIGILLGINWMLLVVLKGANNPLLQYSCQKYQLLYKVGTEILKM